MRRQLPTLAIVISLFLVGSCKAETLSPTIESWFVTIGGDGIAFHGDSIYIGGDGLVCLSFNGTLQWFKKGEYDALDMALYGDSIYTTGFTMVGTGFPVTYDSIVASLSTDGTLQWFKTIGGNYSDQALDIAAYGDSVYITGYTEEFEIKGRDSFIASLSTSDGTLQWFKTIGGSKKDLVTDIAVSGDSIYISGGTRSFGVEGGDAFVARLSLDGNLRWFRTIGGSKSDYARDIDVSGDNIYITGETDSYRTGEYGFDLFVASLSTDGNFRWFRTIDDNPYYFASAVKTYGDSVYVAGGTMPSIPGNQDVFTASFSASDGSLQWFKTIGGSKTDVVHEGGLAVYDGSIYITGFTESFGNATAFSARLVLDYISSEDPGDMLWTAGELWPPVSVDSVEKTDKSQQPSIKSQSPDVQTHTPSVTTQVQIFSQEYPDTHIAVISEFPLYIIPLFFIATLVAVGLSKKHTRYEH